jgi:hypothetical protein
LTHNADVKSVPRRVFYVVIHPIQWIPGAESPGREANYSPHLLSRSAVFMARCSLGHAQRQLRLLPHKALTGSCFVLELDERAFCRVLTCTVMNGSDLSILNSCKRCLPNVAGTRVSYLRTTQNGSYGYYYVIQ